MKCPLWIVALAIDACAPDLASNDTLVTTPRILAVRPDPAEAPPGTSVTFTPLVADSTGTAEAPAIAWSYCLAPKPLTEDNAVSNACLDAGPLMPLGVGPMTAWAIPNDACSLFGPNAPASGASPRDPDSTGGYYQPLRADLSGADPTFDLVRITCGLANASAPVAAAFARAYRPNENPKLLPVVPSAGGNPASLSAVRAGSRLDLAASWPAASAETYAWYDATSDTVSSQREAMQVAWYASAGSFDEESTARAADDPATTSTNTWTVPLRAGTARLWIVLRDSRGGVDFATYEPTVVPP